MDADENPIQRSTTPLEDFLNDELRKPRCVVDAGYSGVMVQPIFDA